MKWCCADVLPIALVSDFHHSTSEYGVLPQIEYFVALPVSDGEPWFCVIEYPADGPFPPAPAQTVQLSHPPRLCTLDTVEPAVTLLDVFEDDVVVVVVLVLPLPTV